MTANAFGGPWTADKLDVLRKYLHFYVAALKDQPYQLYYIDTFAGTGRCRIRHEDGTRDIDGSARIALDCGGFDRYFFIEHKRQHAQELQSLMDSHPRGSLAYLRRGKARDLLWPLLMGFDRKTTRGVLFLDPYGLQVDWPMVSRIAATRALDVFFLVSLSGLYRNAAVDRAAINQGHRAALTRFLGTDEWIDAVYVHKQDDLFGDHLVTRAPGYEGMLDYATQRLRTVFPYVGEPCLLGSANGAPLFALYFAVSNDSKAALALASRVSEDILRHLR
ncbi:MAG: three-Cys-motif partner protein TcmP [Pseudomonadota bacterium]|jgi:three-Cys-motif partner protein